MTMINEQKMKEIVHYFWRLMDITLDISYLRAMKAKWDSDPKLQHDPPLG